MNQTDPIPVPHTIRDLTGEVIGKLTVISYQGKTPDRTHNLWLCRCECGTEKVFRHNNLTTPNHTTSCGCHKKAIIKAGANYRHGYARAGATAPEYTVWVHMKSRCQRPDDGAYHNYGGRGIKVCQRWDESFENFIADMGERPTPKHTIERKDVNGDYCPENCIWLPRSLQGLNLRRNRHLTARGETMTLIEWSRRTGLNSNAILYRLRKGWTDEQALYTPRGQPPLPPSE